MPKKIAGVGDGNKGALTDEKILTAIGQLLSAFHTLPAQEAIPEGCHYSPAKMCYQLILWSSMVGVKISVESIANIPTITLVDGPLFSHEEATAIYHNKALLDDLHKHFPYQPGMTKEQRTLHSSVSRLSDFFTACNKSRELDFNDSTIRRRIYQGQSIFTDSPPDKPVVQLVRITDTPPNPTMDGSNFSKN